MVCINYEQELYITLVPHPENQSMRSLVAIVSMGVVFRGETPVG